MSEQKQINTTKAGPWGKLEYYYTYLDPPDVFSQEVRRETTEWAFFGLTKNKAELILTECGIDVTPLNANGHWLVAKDGVIATPPNSIVSDLSPEARQLLYSRLLKMHNGSFTNLNDFVIERGAYRENVVGLQIPENIIKLVEERSIKIGEKSIFAETAFALSQIPDPDTKTRFLKSLCRNRSLVARVKIDSDSNLKMIAKWWKAGPNRSRSLPLLETALRTRGVDTIDLLHFLPPVPRRLLNTYPSLLDQHLGSNPDCYFAAMNFFSEFASSRYLDDIPREYYFADGFKKVGAPWQFGDVKMIVDRKTNRFIHAYIYIADDIVFTKNGKGKFFPYVLMRHDDLMSRYIEDKPFSCETYRIEDLN